jgi:glutathione synthase/RimK-type ligase-like ATP-grasp enzyme
MKNTFLIVGKSFSSLVKAIENRGDSWILLKDSGATRQAKKPHQINVDFADKTALRNEVSKLNGKIDGVIAIYENYIVTASEIAEMLGLPVLPIESAKACTDKELMRTRFLACEEPISPQFKKVSNYIDVEEFADKFGYPVIIKPANLAKSLLVLKCSNKNELKANYLSMDRQISKVYAKHAPNQTPKIIIEEFLEGSIHSVDAFVDSQGKPSILSEIVDYQTGYDIGYDDNFHYSRILPTQLSDDQQKELIHTAELGCSALGMKNSAAHIEIILTKKGPRIVEIGARNGGYRERMHKLANNIDLLDIQLDLKLGMSPKIAASKSEPVAVLELFPKQSGIFTGITNEDKLRKLSSLVYFKIKQNLGEHVGKAGDGYKMCAIIILHNPNPKQFEKDLDFVNKNVRVITD